MQEKETPIQPDETPEADTDEAQNTESADMDASKTDAPSDSATETPDVAEPAAETEKITPEPQTDSDAVDETPLEDEDEESLEDDPELRGILESLIFASDEPITFRQIKDIIAPEAPASEEKEDAPGRRRRKKKRFTITRVKRAIDVLNAEYEESRRSFRIIEVSGGFAFQTTSDYGNWVGKLFAERSRRRLTQSALETLSIIAFRQPISKPAVEGIRGVNAEHVVKSLLERNLISIVGREDSPGRPLLYGTTKTFLRHFGLSSINDLPRPREIKDLLSSEDELAMHPIDEMDPTKAAELTRVSSQELERLFETAQLQPDDAAEDTSSTAETDAPEEVSSPEGTAAPDETADAEEAAAPDAEAIDDTADEPVEASSTEAPVLRVQFDDEGTDTEEADPEANEGDASSEQDDSIEDDENPFDDETPDESEVI